MLKLTSKIAVSLDCPELRIEVAAHHLSDFRVFKKCVISFELLIDNEQFQDIASQLSRQVEHQTQAIISRIAGSRRRYGNIVSIVGHDTRIWHVVLVHHNRRYWAAPKLMEIRARFVFWAY